jgi:hypothetical protein
MAALEILSAELGADRAYAEKLAGAYLARKMNAKAEALYRGLLKISDESPEYWAGLAAAVAPDHGDAAAEAYRKAILFSDDARQREVLVAELRLRGVGLIGRERGRRRRREQHGAPTVPCPMLRACSPGCRSTTPCRR